MKNRFAGAPYPITEHPRGLFHIQTGLNQIKSDMLSLILTNRGERVMLPDFGVDLRRFLFEPNDELLRRQVRDAIARQLELWEPRVAIEAIEITSGPDRDDLNTDDDLTERDAILLVRILFIDPVEIQEVQELRLEVPLPGA